MEKDILKLADTIIRGEKAIVFPLIRNNQWVSDSAGHHIFDMRGWGYIQYLEGEGKAEKFQDDFCDWIIETLNAVYEFEMNPPSNELEVN